MDSVQCPHCGAENDAVAAFCMGCGKAVPQPAAEGGPRIIESGQLAASSSGQTLQSQELHKQAKKAAGALLAVAILQWVFGAVIVFMLSKAPDADVGPGVYVVVFGIGVLFFGLYLWARRNPLPAAISGLVVFVTVHLLDALADPTALVRGIILKVIIIVVLARAISAGVQHRRLQREMAAA